MSAQFIDLQVNGHGGIDLLSAETVEDVRKVSRSLYKHQLVGYLPTLITSSIEAATRALKLIEEVRQNPESGEALILGTHLEGPFISLEKRGVHPPGFIVAPDIEHMKSLLGAGLIKQVTLAPELPGAIDLIKYLVSEGVLVSLGHTSASMAEAEAGFNAGAKTVTHLFNAMPKPPLTGLAQVAIEREDVVIQIIIDQVHVSNELLVQTLPKIMNRFIVVNDAVAAAGLGDGVFPFGAMEVKVANGQARRVDGTLAGGVATFADSIKIMQELAIAPNVIQDSLSTRPAALIGINYLDLLEQSNKISEN